MSKLLIERTALDKIQTYTALCDKEISGLGRVTFIDGTPVVTDVAIFDQQVSATHSTIDPLALAKFQDERVKAGESMKDWVLWWHSHAYMDVFFSTTDTNTIESSTEFPYLVSLVVNKKKKTKARLDVFNPVHMYMDLDVEVLDDAKPDIVAHCQSEIDAKIKYPAPMKYEYKKSDTQKIKDFQSMSDWYSRDDKAVRDLMDDVPNRSSGFQLGDTDVDTFAELEYDGHKVWLIEQISKADRKGKKQKADKFRAELAQHLTWGRSTGMEVTRVSD